MPLPMYNPGDDQKQRDYYERRNAPELDAQWIAYQESMGGDPTRPRPRGWLGPGKSAINSGMLKGAITGGIGGFMVGGPWGAAIGAAGGGLSGGMAHAKQQEADEARRGGMNKAKTQLEQLGQEQKDTRQRDMSSIMGFYGPAMSEMERLYGIPQSAWGSGSPSALAAQGARPAAAWDRVPATAGGRVGRRMGGMFGGK